MKQKVAIADLTHTTNGMSANTFPLGTAFVASYAQDILGNAFDFQLHKFPQELADSIFRDPPAILAFANYSWNIELSHKLAEHAKKRSPQTVVIAGGPNFPVSDDEKIQFLKQRWAIDFYIEYEGEIGFTELLQRLDEYSFDVLKLKDSGQLINNCSYLVNDDRGHSLVSGPVKRIENISVVPSPYLNGMLDRFFDFPLVPMIETTRGCPFSCAFCADGLTLKSKIKRLDDDRTKTELRYIAERVKDIDELYITDLNFGMYPRDIETAENIAEIQSEFNWPTVIGASAGKNKPALVKDVAKILKGTWIAGAAIQSTDEQVLNNIKRSNISKDAYFELTDFINSLDSEALTYTEIILGLPGDTKEKHYESLRYAVDSHVDSIRMYQAILLPGTSMASRETRDQFGLQGKFRIMPGSVGKYQFGPEQLPVAEIEEIIVASNDLTLDDYVTCRIMNLYIETYFNNSLCEEFFAALRAMGLSVFDFLVYLQDHYEMYTPRIKEILESFISHTKDDLYDSYDDAKSVTNNSAVFNKYVQGELGSNELLDHKALLYLELPEIMEILTESIKHFLKSQGMLNTQAVTYFEEVKAYSLARKENVQDFEMVTIKEFKFDFKSIEALDFEVDPRQLAEAPEPVPLKFFHDSIQKDLIRNAVNLYSNHPGGIGRMIQRNNLNKMFRKTANCNPNY